jgi:hypothetical protein
VVHGQTFQEWFRDTYIFDYQGTSPEVSGFYFDDWWPEPAHCCPKEFPFGMPPDNMICYNDSTFVKAGGGPCDSWCTHAVGTAPGCGDDSKHMCASASCPATVSGFSDAWPNMTEDMGLTAADQMQISKSYQANMATVYAEIMRRGMFSWQQQWNGQSSPTAKTGCCTQPLVRNGSSCAPTLRKLCAANSMAQNARAELCFLPRRLQRRAWGRAADRPPPRHCKFPAHPRSARVPRTRLGRLLQAVRGARTDQLGLVSSQATLAYTM